MHAVSPLVAARPFLWLAAIGFAVGFVGYLLLGGGAHALDQRQLTPIAEAPAFAQDSPRAA